MKNTENSILRAKDTHGVCPYCGVYTYWQWETIVYSSVVFKGYFTTCNNCKGDIFFNKENIMVSPDISRISLRKPHASLSRYPKSATLFKESIDIAGLSPRASLTLARMAVECIVKEILEALEKVPNENLSANIKTLKDQGIIPDRVVDILETIRIIGNKSIHNLSLIDSENEITASDVDLVWRFIDLILDRIEEMEKIDQLESKVQTKK